MKKITYVIVIIIIIFWQNGCQENKEKLDKSSEEERSAELVVYMSAPTHTFLSYDDGGEEIYTRIYPSRQVIGSVITGGDVASPNANIVEKAVAEYAKEENIQIEIRYLQEFSNDGEILQSLVDNNEKLPDVLIFNKEPHYDYYRLAEQGYLLDLSDFFVQDEIVNNAEGYYQTVLDGGIMFQKRYAMPILFNLNGLMTSSSFLYRMGKNTLEENITYDEIIELLQDSCIEVKDDIYTAAIHEASGYRGNGRYIPSILLGSAYPQYFDETSYDLIVSEEVISSICHTMDLFNQQEFTSISKWEDKAYVDNVSSDQTKTIRLLRNGNVDENFGVFLSGGRSGGASFYNSLLTDVTYYQTIYEEMGQELVFTGIPTVEKENKYSANISLAAFGMASTEYPEEVYKLIRYLMDYEFPAQYGFSVNKRITEDQIDNIQKSAITIYPPSIWDGVNSVKSYEELQKELKYTKPLKSEYAAIIQNMLENIEGAGLPYGMVEYYMFDSMSNLIGDQKLTPQEAGHWMIVQWEQYLDIQSELAPFYDEGFLNSITLIGSPSNNG